MACTHDFSAAPNGVLYLLDDRILSATRIQLDGNLGSIHQVHRVPASRDAPRWSCSTGGKG